MNQYQNDSIPSLGSVRSTQWGPSTAAMQARGRALRLEQARGPRAAARAG